MRSSKLLKKQGANYERKIKNYLQQKYIVIKTPSNYAFDFICINRKEPRNMLLVEVRSTHRNLVKIPRSKIKAMIKFKKENLKRMNVEFLGVVVFIGRGIIKYLKLDQVKDYWVKPYEN